MDQRLSLVTLAVADVEASAAFYGRLGWTRHASSMEGQIVFFQLDGMALALFGREALAEDAALPASAGTGGPAASYAINFPDRAAVDRAWEEAGAAGATLLKRPVEVFWGGYSGYFADPDGHLWEIAHNPFWTLDEKGRVSLDRG